MLARKKPAKRRKPASRRAAGRPPFTPAELQAASPQQLEAFIGHYAGMLRSEAGRTGRTRRPERFGPEDAEFLDAAAAAIRPGRSGVTIEIDKTGTRPVIKVTTPRTVLVPDTPKKRSRR